MSSNYWDQQQGDGQNPRQHSPSMNGNGNGVPRAGSLLRSYNASQQMPPPQGWPTPQGPSPLSPIPPSSSRFLQQSQQQFPQFPQVQQQMSPAPQDPRYQQGGRPPSVIANAMNTVRRWSGKMAAARGGYVDPNPLILHRPPALEPINKRAPWKRSHALRVAMQMRHRRARWQRSRPNKKRILTITFSVLAALLVILIASGFGAAYGYYQSEYPRVQQLANQQTDQSTRIYDRNFKLIYTAYNGVYGRGTPITYSEVPGFMQDAMTATEDHSFWDNSGIDPQGILRAATEYFSNGGTVNGGGSTITQQVIKNLTGDTQVSLQRKLPEAALAIGLTQQYPKWKILEMYFNVAPFGAQELGVDAAAEDYFGLHSKCDANFNCIPAISFLDRDLTKCKNASDPSTCQVNPLLGLARASLLAGMPQNPPGYDPTVSKDNVIVAQGRQDYVLNQMLSLSMNINVGLGGQKTDSGLGPITPAMITQVEALTKTFKYPGFDSTKKDPHFVDWIIPTIENALGNGDGQLGAHLFLTGGFNIRTTIDSNLETYIEQAIHRHLDEPEYQYFLTTYPYGPLNKYHNVNDSAVVVENAHDGEILAMDGSANYNDTSKQVSGNFNAALAMRSPGSSFKPIVYATAFQMGWYPGIVLPDKKTYFPNGSNLNVNTPGGAYIPFDYGNTYNNKNWNVQLDISNSFNVPAIKTLEYAGLDNVVAMAQRLGITTVNTHNAVTSLALGSVGVPLIQMTQAYQVFANQGVRVQPQGVLDIWDNYGHHIYHLDPNHPQGVQVMSKQIAYLMTSMLTNEYARAYEFENDHVLSMWDWNLPDGSHPQVAAKTGTTDSFVDNWTMGYTSNVVVGVWSGNADNSPMDNHVVGITGAAPIWHDVIERVSGHCNDDGIPCGNISTVLPAQPFTVPPGIISQEVNTVNGLAGTGYATLMLDGMVPTTSGLTKPTTGNGTPTVTPTP